MEYKGECETHNFSFEKWQLYNGILVADHIGKVLSFISARPPPLIPPTTWTNAKIREFKTKMTREKNAQMIVKRGEVVTVRVPTHPDGKRICWEFATEDYDIGFGVYFDWTSVTSTAITVQVSESSDEDDEEEEEFEGQYATEQSATIVMLLECL